MLREDAIGHVDHTGNSGDAHPTAMTPEAEEGIRSWLQPTNYNADSGEYYKHRTSHLPGTGDWIWKSAPFTAWHGQDDQGTLWIKGIPGSGKSVIAATLIEKLSQEQVPVLFFFFRQIIDANHSPVALLRDWLDQLLSHCHLLQNRLKEKYIEPGRAISTVSVTELWNEVRMALDEVPRAYFVVDALDEMDGDNDEFLKRLAELGQWRPSQIKVAFTSRPVVNVERALRQERMLEIRLEESSVDIDIATYVDHRLRMSTLHSYENEMIKKAVPGRANGLFLYAKLAMDNFLQKGANIQHVLNSLPLDLGIMYTDLLREHARRSEITHEFQLLILSWATHASRPLRLLEIAEMINVTQKTGLTGGLRVIKNIVRAACGPLLEILPNETISVIHHSLTEFLNGTTRQPDSSHNLEPIHELYPVLEMGPTNSRLAEICISYLLNTNCLVTVRSQVQSEAICGYHESLRYTELCRQHPFLDYSLKNWQWHAHKADNAGSLQESTISNLERLLSEANFPTLLSLMGEKKHIKGQLLLHFAARLGLSMFLEKYITEGSVDVNALDSNGETAMLHAASAGQAQTISVLLANGAKPDEPSNVDGEKPLHKAAKGNHGGVVGMLLEAGVDPMTPRMKGTFNHDDYWRTCKGATPLGFAMLGGHEDAAKAFLPYLNDPKIVRRALAWSAIGGHCSLVKSILAHPLADANARLAGNTPLFLAGTKRHVETMMALVEAGANPSLLSSGDTGEIGVFSAKEDDDVLAEYTPLHALCGALTSHLYGPGPPPVSTPQLAPKLVSLMIEGGLDVNAEATTMGAAIIRAPKWFPGLVAPLLEAGASAKSVDFEGENALYFCSDPKVLELLVKKGMADINHATLKYRLTPFLAHVGKGVEVSKLLVEKFAELGANLAETDYQGKGAMYQLINGFKNVTQGRERLPELIDLLLSLGVPIDARDNEGKNILSLVHDSHDPTIIHKLVSAGADVNARDHNGWTPIFHVVMSSKSEGSGIQALQLLIELGARVDLKDFRGRDALFFRLSSNRSMIDFLMQKGLDIDGCDYEGNPSEWNMEHVNNAGRTYLHHLIENLASGLSLKPIELDGITKLDCKDKDGIRPLHLASRFSEATVAALLAAGASPTEPTHEGITPLHVAARFRRPTIIRMLLQAIEGKLGKDGLAVNLNTSWRRHIPVGPWYTPPALNFACQSGIPESVSLLLAAGADPNLPRKRWEWPLWWCMSYEEEQKLWGQVHRPDSIPFSTPFGIKAEDSFRSYFTLPVENVPRLEEIMDLLHEYGADMAPAAGENHQDLALDYCIQGCTKSDYALECLFRMRQKVLSEIPDATSADNNISSSGIIAYAEKVVGGEIETSLRGRYDILIGLCRREATYKALCRSLSHTDINSLLGKPWILESVLADHQWGVVSHLSKIEPGFFWVDGLSEQSRISTIVSLGLPSLVRSLVTRDRFGEIQKKHQELFNMPVTHRGCESIPSLLAVACARKVGNMATLRVLVENLGANVNLQDALIPNHREKKSYLKGGTGLHTMARLCFPWHIAEGAQYLIHQGANLESRDERGQTPLHWALHVASSSVYRNELGGQAMAKLLIDCGADANAVDGSGRSCLSRACDDLELVKYIVSHGAKINTRVLFEVTWEIEKDGDKMAGILEAICVDADVNKRLSLEELQTMQTSWDLVPSYPVEDHELYLLHVAVSRVPEVIRRLTPWNAVEKIRKVAIPIARALVRNGANPFATYKKRSPLGEGTLVEATLLHDVLEEGGIVEPILCLPSLDLEHRDNKGRTILLAACRSQIGPDSSIDAIRHPGHLTTEITTEKPSLVKFLIDKGACVTAVDDDGKSALHHILESRPIGGESAIRLLISVAPELVGQLDNTSTPPINYSLRRAMAYSPPDCRSAEILLDAGADPNISEPTGNTALHYIAVCLGNEELPIKELQQARELFNRLLSVGLPINNRNDKGETPIVFFMRAQGSHRRPKYGNEFDPNMKQRRWNEEAKRQKEALQILSEIEANVHAVTNSGNTLLHVVSSTSNSRVGEAIKEELMIERFRWLLDRGLDPMAENDRHQTCLDVAASCGNQSILKLFERPT